MSMAVDSTRQARYHGKSGCAEHLAEADRLLPPVMGATPRPHDGYRYAVRRLQSTSNVQTDWRIGDVEQRFGIIIVLDAKDAQAAIDRAGNLMLHSVIIP